MLKEKITNNMSEYLVFLLQFFHFTQRWKDCPNILQVTMLKITMLKMLKSHNVKKSGRKRQGVNYKPNILPILEERFVNDEC